MSTVFLGTTWFAAGILKELAERLEHRPALVITRPDRRRGRGRQLASPPVAQSARELGLELTQPESVNDGAVVRQIAALAPQAVIVCAFGALIKEPLLSAAELLNVHPSLLPRWRGAAPVERAIIAGDARTGVSIMRLTAGLDSGPVCLVGEERIEAQDNYGTLAPRLQRLGAELLLAALDQLGRGERLHFVEQSEVGVTYAEKIEAADRLLDPTRPALELERVVRALEPHIGARVALADGTLLGVHEAALLEGLPASEESQPAGERSSEPGVAASRSAVVARDGRLLLSCAQGVLELLLVQPPGGKPMQASAYLRGRGLPAAGASQS